MSTITSVQLKNATHKELKETCETNKTSISKTLRNLVTLFLNDNGLRERVLNEVTSA